MLCNRLPNWPGTIRLSKLSVWPKLLVRSINQTKRRDLNLLVISHQFTSRWISVANSQRCRVYCNNRCLNKKCWCSSSNKSWCHSKWRCNPSRRDRLTHYSRWWWWCPNNTSSSKWCSSSNLSRLCRLSSNLSSRCRSKRECNQTASINHYSQEVQWTNKWGKDD